MSDDAAIAAGEEVEADGFDFFGSIGEAFATIPANLADLGGTVLDPLGLAVGDVSELETAAEEQAVAFTTFGQMALRFDTRVAAFAYLLFVLMYFPCVAAMGAVYRETNAGWTAFVGCWTTGLAYWSAVLFYQVMMFQNHPASSIAWIVGLSAIAIATIVLMRFSRPARKRRSLQLEGH